MPVQAVATRSTTPQKNVSDGRIVKQNSSTRERMTFSPLNRGEGAAFTPRSRARDKKVGTNYAQERSRNLDGVVAKRNTDPPQRAPRSPRRGPYRQNLRGVAARAVMQGIDPTEAERQVIGAARSLAQKLNNDIAAGRDTGAFMIALSLAAFKDFLDVALTLTGLGLIPGVNFLLGLFLSSFLFFFMMGKGWMRKLSLKIKFWILGLFVDSIPVFSALPINSLLVLDAWRRVRKRGKKAEENMKEIPNLTQRQLERLYAEVEAR